MSAENLVAVLNALEKAILAASQWRGVTDPNPPVGAAILDKGGNILSIGAHQRAGSAHAEVLAIEGYRHLDPSSLPLTLVVTLEPCNHFGKTPPCTEAILNCPEIQNVIVAQLDPNPKVTGNGLRYLAEKGIQTKTLEQVITELKKVGSPEPALLIRALHLQAQAQCLIEAFTRHSQVGLPFVTVKTAHRASEPIGLTLESMKPTKTGQNTFTSKSDLTLAHALRHQAGAILTSAQTFLADNPAFTVRLVEEKRNLKLHPRILVLLDRRGQLSKDHLERAQKLGFEVWHKNHDTELESIFKALAQRNVLEVLVEAGPTLSKAVLDSPFWCKHVQFFEPMAPHVEIKSKTTYRFEPQHFYNPK